MEDKSVHVNEDQLFSTLVDEANLTDAIKGHLLVCRLCQEKRAALIAELESLGKMAKNYTPLPKRKPLIPHKKPKHINVRRLAFAVGFAVILLVAGLRVLQLSFDSSNQMTVSSSSEMVADLYLTEEILEESALPDYYQDITPLSTAFFDEDFLGFVAPLDKGDNIMGINGS